jgi:hypothetical protein
MSSVLLRVQARGRLVEQQQLGLGGERAPELDHLAHAVGQPGDEVVAVLGEIEEIDHLLHRLALRQLGGAPPGRNSSSCHKRVLRWRWRPMSRFCSTVACSNSSMFWKVRAMPRSATWCGDRPGEFPVLEENLSGSRRIDQADQVERWWSCPRRSGPMMV